MPKKGFDLFRPHLWDKKTREQFLDTWWEMDKDRFLKYYDSNNKNGTAIIVQLKLDKPEIFGSIVDSLDWNKYATEESMGSSGFLWWRANVKPLPIEQRTPPAKKKRITWTYKNGRKETVTYV